MSKGMEIKGIALGITGWIVSIVTGALPMWRGTSLVNAQTLTEQNILNLPQELLASRAMSVIVIILAMLGVMNYMIGTKCTKCTNCIMKAKVMISSGVMFISAGIMELISVAWETYLTIRDTKELEASIYVGFAAAALILIGGALLCCTCPAEERKYKMPRMGDSCSTVCQWWI
ncbi:claudin-3-like [Carassius carassius]|uniref:claudin-3-like n=1 Tax=Carassius carassius TaxID=217509 RepID=UPI002868C37D|nr:claudin-3-like [Carassius carassius]